MTGEFVIAISMLLERVRDIITEPAGSDMLWILIPMIAALFLMELYFGRYKEEELGWNTAVSNALVLFFVGMNLCYFLSTNNLLVGITAKIAPEMFSLALKKSFIAYFIIIESIFLLLLNFCHLSAKRFAFGISSGMILNFIGIMAIILVQSPSRILLNEWITLPAIVVIFIVVLLFFLSIKALSPKAEEEEEE